MAGPRDEQAATPTGRGHLRASPADLEQTIDTLKVAYVQDRLTKDEFDGRIGQTLIARTHAELATLTSDIPAGLAGTQRPGKPHRVRASNAAKWCISGLVTPGILAAAFAFGSLRGDGGYGAMAFVIAFVYFVFWLSVGVDMLWEWHCMSLPRARMCVRCAHSAASHRAPTSCAVRLSSLNMRKRCLCVGYVPPGLSPETVDLNWGCPA
jgi:hypothetical protein